MTTKSFTLAKLIGDNNKISQDKFAENIVLGPEQYTTPDDLPLSGNQIGDQAFVASNNRLYIWSGSGWYSIALINTNPSFDSGGSPEATYELDSIGGTVTTITLSATDPEGIPIQYSAIPSDSAGDLATITQTDNVFVVTARSLDSIIANGYDRSGGTFNITFRASDGVNLATALSEFTLTFYTFQGSNFGYTSGGTNGPTIYNIIDKFPFASDANATDVGGLSNGRSAGAGQSSVTHGYTSGGTPPVSNVIDKFSFAVDANATDVGDLSVARYSISGQSSSENGYSSGGAVTPTSFSNIIDKFPFAADANATDVGDLTLARSLAAGQSSSENGYSSGGFAGPLNININIIDKFPFAADANATDVGDLTVARRSVLGGQSSSENGYTAGGLSTTNWPGTNVIDKFPFAADANATDAGDLTVARGLVAGQSSSENGYSSGGFVNPPVSNVIEKFPFAVDANATDVGDLTVARYSISGQQY